MKKKVKNAIDDLNSYLYNTGSWPVMTAYRAYRTSHDYVDPEAAKTFMEWLFREFGLSIKISEYKPDQRKEKTNDGAKTE